MRAANASVKDEYNGLFTMTLTALSCKTCELNIRVILCLSPQTRSAYSKRNITSLL